ncbi:hypothetical protein C1Y26_03350 [Pseudomonas sp. MPR-R2A7]|nr:hypothetical protein C1Y23_01440 [Pseudomonas sp. GW460-12]PMX36998.1 hypothetical protein C1Y24_04480 [Pseudomonas sp. MPR-R2A4]PMX43394.1 hypothetical protein C1Y26_03350 [Pseudomonas sp. MPR-R2A7]PMX53366.1 hypothetical protein C1Y17_14135 [Pseudomonas sp. MPR-R2A6]PMX93558.1 hypothetical protein C1Y21_02895 [Pseudomonas sp. MPR-R2A3]PMY12633.1 hypothetical protein C1Y22_15630 [Pseudomonas sp. MPR-R2A5]PNA36501.1 hypothetical protein C1Y16_03385 [Pseudomonas sp. MPR-ANB1]PNA50993.1 hyp
MATGVSICSNALLMLGAQTINDFNEPVDRAKLAANLYPTIRDDLLRAHPWNCTIKRALLAPDATPPAFGYDNQFELPADFLRVLEVGQNGCQIDYLVEGRSILADATSLELRYVYLNEIENTWDASLVGLLTLAMASAMAYPITQSSALQAAFEQKLAMAKKVARAVDGQEDPPQTLGDERLYASRFGAHG